MDHPLITIDPESTPEQLQERITDLTQKLTIAMRTGNGNLCHQIRMALGQYQEFYQRRIRELEQRSNMPDYSDRIDISR